MGALILSIAAKELNKVRPLSVKMHINQMKNRIEKSRSVGEVDSFFRKRAFFLFGGFADEDYFSTMSKPDNTIISADTITKLGPDSQAAVIVSGSHGGVYPAYLARKAGARAVILNDAGIGKDQAGIASLAYSQRHGMAAAVVDYRSARIGDTADMLENGVISACNAQANDANCWPGMPCLEAAYRLCAAPLSNTPVEPYAEARGFIASNGPRRVIVVDSVSLVLPDDFDQIVVTGSHGGLVGGNKAAALKVDAFAVVYNDAGIGKDRAGISRLPALAERGILAATVAASSAGIGNARSSYEDGRVSALNEPALRAGVVIGMPLRELVAQWQQL